MGIAAKTSRDGYANEPYKGGCSSRNERYASDKLCQNYPPDASLHPPSDANKKPARNDTQSTDGKNKTAIIGCGKGQQIWVDQQLV